MKALIFETYSKEPEIKEVPIPKPKKDEVFIKVAYCGINRIDLATLAGRFGDKLSFPLILGTEIVGTLPNGQQVAVNPYLHCGKCRFCKKKEYLVCEQGRPLLGVQKNGGYAEFVVVPKDNIIPIPEELTFQDAAAGTVSGGTAYRMIFKWAEIRKNDWVIVSAAGSGVGVYSCQFAILAGAKVIALASEKKLEKLRTLGIKYLINYIKNNWEKEVLRIVNDQPISIAIDTVGGSIFESLVKLVSPLGKIVFCGATENPQIRLNLIDLYVKQLQLIGSSGFMNEDLVKIFNLVKTKKIKPVIDSIFPLAQIHLAWEKLRLRKVFGKILIRI